MFVSCPLRSPPHLFSGSHSSSPSPILIFALPLFPTTGLKEMGLGGG